MAETAYPYMTSRVEGDILILTLTEPKIQGEGIAETLRQDMVGALDAARVTKVIIDFQHAQYISSAAFRPLLALRRKLQDRGGRIVLCGLSPVIGDVFYTTRMVGDDGSIKPLFEMKADVASAMEHLSAAPGPTPA